MRLSEEQHLSVKELRYEFPSVIDRLDKGEQFVLIHRSKPIARLMPYTTLRATSLEALSLWANSPRSLRVRGKRSAVKLVRKERV